MTNETLEWEMHELCKLFPPMPEDQFNALVDDIQANGLRHPIIIHENKILDGRHRYRACRAIGRQPVSVIYDGNDPLGFVISHNLNRRHLDESQRAMIGARLANLKVGQRKDTTGPIGLSTLTQPEAASKLSVGERSIKRARKVIHNQ